MTSGGKAMHAKHVKDLKKKIDDYGIDPFSREKPKYFATGVEISNETVSDMFKVENLGNSQFLKFVNSRLIDGTAKFFDPIPKNKLRSGVEVKKKKQSAVEIMKEDKQAFGLIVAKSVNMEDAFLLSDYHGAAAVRCRYH